LIFELALALHLTQYKIKSLCSRVLLSTCEVKNGDWLRLKKSNRFSIPSWPPWLVPFSLKLRLLCLRPILFKTGQMKMSKMLWTNIKKKTLFYLSIAASFSNFFLSYYIVFDTLFPKLGLNVEHKYIWRSRQVSYAFKCLAMCIKRVNVAQVDNTKDWYTFSQVRHTQTGTYLITLQWIA